MPRYRDMRRLKIYTLRPITETTALHHMRKNSRILRVANAFSGISGCRMRPQMHVHVPFDSSNAISILILRLYHGLFVGLLSLRAKLHFPYSTGFTQ